MGLLNSNLEIRRQWNDTFNILRKIILNLDFLSQTNYPSSWGVGHFRDAKCLSPMHTFSGRYCRMWAINMMKPKKEEAWNSGNRGFNRREKTSRNMGEGSSRTTTMQQVLKRNKQSGAEGYKGSRRKENKRTDGSFHAFDCVENCIERLLQNVGRLNYRNK